MNFPGQLTYELEKTGGMGLATLCIGMGPAIKLS
jgi:hypothetical protein